MAPRQIKQQEIQPPVNSFLAYRRHFMVAGFVIGLLLSVWYLVWVNRQAVAGIVQVDTVPQRAVNVFLILFAATFQASLLCKLIAWLQQKFTGKGQL